MTASGQHPGKRMVAFEALPTAAVLSRDGRVVAVNAAYERFVGYPASELEGRTFDALVGLLIREGDAPLVDRQIAVYEAGGGRDGELWLRLTDATGNARPIRIQWFPSGRDGESVVYFVEAEAEETARSDAQGLARAAGELGRCGTEAEVLERAVAVLQGRGFLVTTLLLREGDPLLVYGPSDAHPDLLAARPRREILWEFNREFHQRRAAFFQDVGPLVERAYPGELGRRVQARVIPRRTIQAPLFVNDQPYGALVLTSDTLNPALAGSIEMFAELVARALENVRLRTELVQRERLAALGEAAAVMAHEVRNPVAAILNAATLLEKGMADPLAQAALRRVIGEEAHRLDRLVSDLLDLGRPLTPRIKSTDLHDLAERTVGVLSVRGEIAEALVVVVRPDTPVLAAIDPELAELALSNILRNAAQASPVGVSARVHVAATSRGACSAIVVDDDGPGFPAEQAERILEPFHTTRATGTGIGLAVVRRVVECCSGTIEIGASPTGGGRFTMVFPRGG